MLARLACVVFSVAATISGAMSAETTIGGVSINLPAPAGYCELMDGEPSDQRMIAFTAARVAKGGNKLISISADCQQLVDWRAGKRKLLDDFAQYQTHVGSMNASVPAGAIKEICAQIRTEGNKAISDQVWDMKSRIEQASDRIKMNEVNFLGVVAEEPSVCYAAMMMKISTEFGTEKTQVSIYAYTSVKNKLLFVYRFAPYVGYESVTKGLEQLKADVVALFAANTN